jgi:hypothetical protein
MFGRTRVVGPRQSRQSDRLRLLLPHYSLTANAKVGLLFLRLNDVFLYHIAESVDIRKTMARKMF